MRKRQNLKSGVSPLNDIPNNTILFSTTNTTKQIH